jgi:SAM-dependent methyltransferase
VGQADGENALSSQEDRCFICRGTTFDKRTDPYRRCTNCGHEVLVQSRAQGYIVNDPLSETDVRRRNGLDRFKSKVLCRFDAGLDREQLLDIGSASGKFILHNGSRYGRAIGIEITPEALSFSRDVMRLAIVENIGQVASETTMATAWHSLEHIPEGQLLALLDELSRRLADNGRFLISVPNGASRQYRWFGSAYAFFDVPNHLHQFTQDSLERLLARFGFRLIGTVRSWPYNSFGYVQGLLNVITGTHNYLYYRLKRRSRKASLPLDLLHAVLLPVLAPLGWLLALLDAANMSSQGVITACFEKRRV